MDLVSLNSHNQRQPPSDSHSSQDYNNTLESSVGTENKATMSINCTHTGLKDLLAASSHTAPHNTDDSNVVQSTHDYEARSVSLFQELMHIGQMMDMRDITAHARLSHTVFHRIVSMHDHEVIGLPDNQKRKPMILDLLGNIFNALQESDSNLQLINRVIACRKHAVSLTADNDPIKSPRLFYLGESLLNRMAIQNTVMDLDWAIECLTHARRLFQADYVYVPRINIVGMLARAHAHRYQETAQLSDLNLAIEYQIEIISLAEDRHPHKPAFLRQLGVFYQERFDSSNVLTDISHAVEYHIQALLQLNSRHKDCAEYFGDLGISFRRRFEGTRGSGRI
ncbi:hypothetical protein BDV93DRAFT_612103 [Ceratobasidium sp. AG-I]|nr:hypothetical protein BDV93DRAFT_612103 [Ceratobasidium sp. AG-I]